MAKKKSEYKRPASNKIVVTINRDRGYGAGKWLVIGVAYEGTHGEVYKLRSLDTKEEVEIYKAHTVRDVVGSIDLAKKNREEAKVMLEKFEQRRK